MLTHSAPLLVIFLFEGLSPERSRARSDAKCRGMPPARADGKIPLDEIRLKLTSFFLERLDDDREVAVAEPKIDDLLPLVGQAGECTETVIGRLLRGRGARP